MFMSKKQFKSAVERLRVQLTPSHLTTMITKALERSKSPLTSEELVCLQSVENKLGESILLDRRRAENYLSHALYGKNHDRIAHCLLDDKKTVKTIRGWDDLASRYELYGGVLRTLNPNYDQESDGALLAVKFLSEKLVSAGVAGFDVVASGFKELYCSLEDNLVINCGAVRVEFAGVRLDIEAMYFKRIEMDSYGESPTRDTFRVSVNGSSAIEFIASLGVEGDDWGARVLESLLVTIAADVVELVIIPRAADSYTTTGVRLEDTDFSYALKGMTLCEFSINALKDSMLMFYLSEMKDGLIDCFYENGLAHSFTRRDFGVTVTGWHESVEEGGYKRSGILVFEREGFSVKIQYTFTPFSDCEDTSHVLSVSINEERLLFVEDFDEISEEASSLESCLKEMYPFLVMVSEQSV